MNSKSISLELGGGGGVAPKELGDLVKRYLYS